MGVCLLCQSGVLPGVTSGRGTTDRSSCVLPGAAEQKNPRAGKADHTLHQSRRTSLIRSFLLGESFPIRHSFCGLNFSLFRGDYNRRRSSGWGNGQHSPLTFPLTPKTATILRKPKVENMDPHQRLLPKLCACRTCQITQANEPSYRDCQNNKSVLLSSSLNIWHVCVHAHNREEFVYL